MNKNTKSIASDGQGTRTKKAGAATALHELFEKQLKDIYWAEKALIKAIPRMAKKAMNKDLISALENHTEETIEHISRIDKIFALIDKRTEARECLCMKGIIEEAEETMEETEGVVRDAAIIASAQKAEHYEIAAYGTLRAYALALGLQKAADLIQQTLDEEKSADEKLTAIAVKTVNKEALEAGEGEETFTIAETK
jgi:ferritin-like metal-binding protein YciE